MACAWQLYPITGNKRPGHFLTGVEEKGIFKGLGLFLQKENKIKIVQLFTFIVSNEINASGLLET